MIGRGGRPGTGGGRLGKGGLDGTRGENLASVGAATLGGFRIVEVDGVDGI